jgi:hypothetical protein
MKSICPIHNDSGDPRGLRGAADCIISQSFVIFRMEAKIAGSSVSS